MTLTVESEDFRIELPSNMGIAEVGKNDDGTFFVYVKDSEGANPGYVSADNLPSFEEAVRNIMDVLWPGCVPFTGTVNQIPQTKDDKGPTHSEIYELTASYYPVIGETVSTDRSPETFMTYVSEKVKDIIAEASGQMGHTDGRLYIKMKSSIQKATENGKSELIKQEVFSNFDSLREAILRPSSIED